MQRIQLKSVAKFCAGTAVLLATPSAFAIGPQYQIVTDPVGAVGATLNDVCALTLATPLPGGGFNINGGTGTVIGVSNANANGTVFLSILTASHVVTPGLTLADFGVGTGPLPGNPIGNYALSIPLTGNVRQFTLSDPNNPDPKNPLTALAALPEDMDVIQAQINPGTLAGGALAEWNLIAANPISLVAFPTAPPASTGANQPPPGPGNAPGPAIAPNSNPINPGRGFTQIGYGLGATYNTAAAVANPLTNTQAAAANTYVRNPTAPPTFGTPPPFVRRFINNTATSIEGASANNELSPTGTQIYFEPRVDAAALPASPSGGGITLRGDSGGPLLISAPGPNQAVNPIFNDPAAANPAIPATVPINFTNSEAAVFWGITFPKGGNPLNVATTTQEYIPLTMGTNVTNGSLNWANQFTGPNGALAVPEPGTLSLIALGGFSLLRRRRARR